MSGVGMQWAKVTAKAFKADFQRVTHIIDLTWWVDDADRGHSHLAPAAVTGESRSPRMG